MTDPHNHRDLPPQRSKWTAIDYLDAAVFGALGVIGVVSLVGVLWMAWS